jgi:hypothetical protein
MRPVLLIATLVLTLPTFAAEPAVTAPAAPASMPAAAQPAPAKAAGTVARAQFTNAVQNHEPVDQLTTLTNDKTHIVFFTELKDLANQKVTHRWEYQGKVMSEVSFDVGGDRWRVFSSKTLDPSWTGEWKVSVLDGNGSTLSANTFTYEAATAKPAAAPAEAPTPAQPAPAPKP